ncbi:MAG TPA: S41 family peptidase [Phycisphaerales bacterium]|nr:S41 family peptidase [Phycisphaerales bacterium]
MRPMLRRLAALALCFAALAGWAAHAEPAHAWSATPGAGGAPARSAAGPAPLTAEALANLEAAARLLSYIRFFHPSDQAVAVEAWDHLAVELMRVAEPGADAADLARRLGTFFAPIAPTLRVWAGDAADAPPLGDAPAGATHVAYWRHRGAGSIAPEGAGNIYASEVERDRPPVTLPWGARTVDARLYADAHVVKPLGAGIACRFAVKVFVDEGGSIPHAPAETEWSSTDGKPRLTADDRATRLAGVALCWGVMQHFYPYFDVVETDWDRALGEALASAAEAPDRRAYLHTLQELVAKLHDGHGHVFNPSLAPVSMLPLALAWAGDSLVVAATHDSVSDDVRAGDVVLGIEGRPTQHWCEELSLRISAATDGWRRTRLLQALPTELPGGTHARLLLRRPDGAEYSITLARIPPEPIPGAAMSRPADGAELAPGIVYFNLDGAENDALNRALPRLAAAEGIVFDLRGYPGGAGVQLMGHLSREPTASARWNIPIVTMPDREAWEWDESGRWRIPPMEPYLGARIAFVTDGRAISYAESIMGIVEAYGFGEIVGSATAGTNGNVNSFSLPGGYMVSWTGMKVLKHDGSRHHGVGILPTVPIEPTPAGIGAGRDEVLEKAVEVLRAKIEADRAE